ncbi:MAG: transposase [Candidatus Brocadiia bacterium]
MQGIGRHLAAVYGLECASYERCSGCSQYGRVVRVERERDRRTFLPVARTSLKFERLYNKRTSVERVNSRVDVSFGFENHYIRGLKKMRSRCSLALIVMLAMALGRVRESRSEGAGEEDKRGPTLRSLIGAA